MSKIIFFEFAGRRRNMEVQRPHIERLLAAYPESEFHLWDLTREALDAAYIRDWARSHEQVFVFDGLHPGHPIRHEWRRGRGGLLRCIGCVQHKPPYEEVWRAYVGFSAGYPDATYVKMDDDVIWMDTARFGEVLSFLETHPGRIASANVTNNAVCAKYEPGFVNRYRYSTTPEHDSDWWALHTNSEFADLSHRWLLEDLNTIYSLTEAQRGDFWLDREPFRTRIGELISINFVAMKREMLVKAAERMSDRRGDEGAVDSLLPWIIPNFRVAHLSFGPQDARLSEEWRQSIRDQYAQFS